MALIKKYEVEVINVERHNSKLFTLKLKTLGRRFKYKPGQFLHLAIDEYDPTKCWPESRCFSIKTPPCEGAYEISLTYSVVGTFTKRMSNEIVEGKKITVKMPYGSLFDVINPTDEIVFIAGGTGITPYLSLFLNDSFCSFLNPKLYLGFRNKQMNIYSELRKINIFNSSLSVEVLYQDEGGILDIDRILSDNGNKTYVISGPQVMIKKFQNRIIEYFDDETKILIDDWG